MIANINSVRKILRASIQEMSDEEISLVIDFLTLIARIDYNSSLENKLK
jgi:hypothetical protein